MNCAITRNTQGKIIKVTAPDGSKSELFDAIHSIPFLADTDTSVRIMSNALTTNIEGAEKYPNGEPKLFLNSSGKVYDDIEDVVIDGVSGRISAGFKLNGKFTPIVSFDTHNSEKSSTIYNGIREGNLSPKRILDENGDTLFEGKGQFTETKTVTAELFREQAMREMGVFVKIDAEGKIKFPESRTYSVAIKKDGTTVPIAKEDIPSILQDKSVTNKAELALEYINEFKRKQKENTTISKVNNKKTENALYNFLGSLGISITTLEEYKKSYNNRYGSDPDVEALIDTANRVVAFANGQITAEALSEEVAHLAIETFKDKNSIEGALSLVHLTKEYEQYAEIYREKYAPDYTDEVDLETAVRKEILGKILAKQFVENFEGQATPEQQTLWERIKSIFDSFVAKIKNNIRPQHEEVIRNLNNKIIASMKKGAEDFDIDTASGNIFLRVNTSPNEQMSDDIRRLKVYFEDLFQRIVKEPKPDLSKLERAIENLNNTNILSSVDTILSIANQELLKVKSEIESARESGRPISTAEANRFMVIEQNLKPSIEALKVGIQDNIDELTPEQRQAAQELNRQINAIITDISDISPIIRKSLEQLTDDEFYEILDQLALSDKDRELVIQSYKGGGKDLTAIGRLFQLVSKASNPILQLMHRKVVEVEAKTTNDFKESTESRVDTMFDKGMDKEQSKIIDRKNGKKTGFLISMFDWSAIAEARNEKQIDIISNLTGKSKEDINKHIKTNPMSSLLNTDQKFQMKKELEKWEREEIRNVQFNEAYFDKASNRFATVNTSEYTQEYLRNVNRQVLSVVGKYKNKDGTIDKSKMTASEKAIIDNHKSRKLSAANAYDSFGNLKPGLMRVKPSEMAPDEVRAIEDKYRIEIDPKYSGEVTVLAPGYNTLDDLDDESRLAIDMSNLNMLYRKEARDKTKGGFKDSFLDKVLAIEASGESALEWALANGSLSYKDGYFENIDGNITYDKAVIEYIDSIQNPDIKAEKQTFLDEYKKLTRLRKELLKKNTRTGNPIEIDNKKLGSQGQMKIRELDDAIKNAKSAINLPNEFKDRMGITTTSSEVNDDYKKSLIESGLSEYEFAIGHMTSSNQAIVRAFSTEVREYMEGGRTTIKKSYSKFLDRMLSDGIITEDMVEDDPSNAFEIVRDEYARQFVASYFKRFAPRDYQDFVGGMMKKPGEDGAILVSDVIKGNVTSNNLELTPDYSWMSEIMGDEFVNTEYNTEEAGGYYLQPKMKWLNDKFFEMFGIDKNAFMSNPTQDLYKLTPTKNEKAFELLKILTDMHQEVNDRYGEGSSANKFKMVQVTRDGLDKFTGLLTKEGLKDAWRDLYQNRGDEMLFGQMVDAEYKSDINVNVVPKYFRVDVESGPDSLTDNIIHAALSNVKQSFLYENRTEAETQMKAYLYKIENQRYSANGGKELKQGIAKKGQLSNWYKIAEEYLNHHLYGIKQTRNFETEVLGKKVNLTKVASMLQAYSSFTNLAFNPLISLTSYATGVTNNVINRIVGDKYHKSSASFGLIEATRLMKSHLEESGKVNKKNPLTKIYEMLNITNVEERTKNSAYSRGIRLMSKSAYGLDELANKPITAQVALSVLKDIRFYNGRFISYHNLRSLMSKDGKTKAEIETVWSSIENDSLYDNLNLKEGKAYNEKFASKFENPDAEFIRVITNAGVKAKSLIQEVDGVLSHEDRVAAQRDVLYNTVMQHRGWFLINLQRAFKKRQITIDGKVEEGHYRTMWNLLKAMGKSLKTVNPSEAAEFYNNLEEDQRNNLKRVTVETSALLFLMLLGSLILAGDDDDDSYVEDLAQLVYLRTVQEYNTSLIYGIPGSIVDAAERPVPMLDMIKSFNPTALIQVMGEEDKEGNSKFYKDVVQKNFFLTRRAKTFSDLQVQVDAFRFYNTETLWWLGANKK